MPRVKIPPVTSDAAPPDAPPADRTDSDPGRTVVEMLRDEYEAIHGPLPSGRAGGPFATEGDQPAAKPGAALDQGLAGLYAHIHQLPEDVARSALCLSGGGIRSAAFSFGALRALARAGVLQRFHYLSTVSGGGYIGSWLTAWIHRHFTGGSSDAGATPRTRRLAEVTELLAGDTTGAGGLGGDRPPEAAPVAHVRRFTSYLSPHSGAFSLDTWTLAAVYVRNLLLNWLVVLPLLLGALILPRLLADGLLTAGWVAGEVPARLLAVLGPAAVALAAWLAMITRSTLHAHSADVGRAEDWSRREARVLRFAVLWSLVAGLVLYGPGLVAGAWTAIVSVGGVSGMATLVLKRLGDRRGSRGRSPDQAGLLVRFATTGAAVLTIVLILVALAALAHTVIGGIRPLVSAAGAGAGLAATTAVAAMAFALSALAALLVGINEFSLHALYRNRLVRGFLRASRGDEAPASDTAFDGEDDLPLTSLWPAAPASGDPEDAPHLFHVINATLNDLGGTRPEWSERKGVSFTFSPLHFGAHIAGRYGEAEARSTYEPGYRRLRRSDGEAGALRLGTAMSVSGAAASPNMGYHSSAAVTFLLALFNVRLGWWMPAPRGDAAGPGRSPAAVWRAWRAELFGGTRFTAPVLNVSDGGHFDNLGLYEMVRRRCRYIVVIDAGRDGRGTFASLGEALRKIRVDFGVPVTLTGLDLTDGDANPPDRHAYHGTIHYSAVDRVPGPGGGSVPAPDGQLIYIRPAVSGDEPADVQAYRRLNPAFPNETTADQWFTESQFESYRALGEHSIQHLMDYYRASKGQPRPGGTPATRSHRPAMPPGIFCHRIAEAIALMRRHKVLSSHAGGVVYRVVGGRLEFLLVRSTDGLHRILPKGYIEPWEDAATAAVREVREEAGYTLEPVRSLGVASFETKTRKVTTTYFLMEPLTDQRQQGGDDPFEDYREPKWFTIEAARNRAPAEVPDDVIEVLRKAEARIRTHAGGVACRRRAGETDFLLVRSSDAPTYVLPKGHIEPGEEPAAAAEREVEEEAGQRFRAGESLGLFSFDANGEQVVVEYFVMLEPERDGAGEAGEPGRDPRWFTMDEAVQDPMVPRDVIGVLETAAAGLAAVAPAGGD